MTVAPFNCLIVLACASAPMSAKRASMALSVHRRIVRAVGAQQVDQLAHGQLLFSDARAQLGGVVPGAVRYLEPTQQKGSDPLQL